MTTAVAEQAEVPVSQPKASTKAELTLPLKSLQKALALVAPAVERKTTIPVLGSVRVEQTEDAIQFAATNLELAIVVDIPTPNRKRGNAFLLPALKTESYVKLLSGEVISLSTTDSRATLRCGRSLSRLPLMSVANFPKLDTSPTDSGVLLTQEVFDRILGFIIFAISSEESRYTLHGALLEVTGDKLTLIATDGHRLARYTIQYDGEKAEVLLPAGLLSAINKTLDAKSDLPADIVSKEETIFARVPGKEGVVLLSHKTMQGKFPNYKAVMPQTFAARITVDACAMEGALRRCLNFADAQSGHVRLTISTDEIKLRSASAGDGETDEVVDVVSASTADGFTEFVTGFNGTYLLDAFARLEGNVEMRFSKCDANNSMMLVASPNEDELFEYVVMPQRNS